MGEGMWLIIKIACKTAYDHNIWVNVIGKAKKYHIKSVLVFVFHSAILLWHFSITCLVYNPF